MTDMTARSTSNPSERHTEHDGRRLAARDGDQAHWAERSRVVLTPIAAPSIMGLTGFTMATLMVGAWQAGWYGTNGTPSILWPLALVAGGLLQLVAATMGFRARDGVAVAVHSTWGAFWLGWGLLQLLVTTHVLAPIVIGEASPDLAFWFIGLTLITFTCMLGTVARRPLLSAMLAALTGGAAITAAGFYAGSATTLHVAGWFLVVAAALAWLVLTGMVLEHAYARTIIPLGTADKQGNVPGRRFTVPVEYPMGMPGARVGQ